MSFSIKFHGKVVSPLTSTPSQQLGPRSPYQTRSTSSDPAASSALSRITCMAPSTALAARSELSTCQA